MMNLSNAPQLASPVIRPATVHDHAAVWGILEPVFRAGATYAIDRDIPRAAAIAYWLGEDKHSFVAEVEGAVVGTYYLRQNQPGGGRHVCNCGYIVGEAARGRGLARQMAEHSFTQAVGLGFKAMQYNFVVSTNTGAIGLWQALGFAIVGRLPGAFDHPTAGRVDALVMYRDL